MSDDLVPCGHRVDHFDSFLTGFSKKPYSPSEQVKLINDFLEVSSIDHHTIHPSRPADSNSVAVHIVADERI